MKHAQIVISSHYRGYRVHIDNSLSAEYYFLYINKDIKCLMIHELCHWNSARSLRRSVFIYLDWTSTQNYFLFVLVNCIFSCLLPEELPFIYIYLTTETLKERFSQSKMLYLFCFCQNYVMLHSALFGSILCALFSVNAHEHTHTHTHMHTHMHARTHRHLIKYVNAHVDGCIDAHTCIPSYLHALQPVVKFIHQTCIHIVDMC